MSRSSTFSSLLMGAAVCAALLSGTVATAQTASATPPEAPREFRGVWVSSVYNGNWPSKKGLPVAQQQAELVAIMERAKSLNLNAVIFQVRPGADAMYASKIEPWSEYLTGVQGKPPEPFYDPLAFAVQEAHRRGLQLHAWFNPYRAATRNTGDFASNHVSRTMPDAIKKLDKLMWMDPGNKQAQDQTIAVIADVVSRYDVDGVQFDDYFYPYASEVKNTGMDFLDDNTWQQYQAGGGKLSRSDWRRNNVDNLMRDVYATVKKIKPRVYFGIAPFGIWRPGHPAGIVGMDPYEQLYADSRKWLVEGWLDYCSPQLYWELSKTGQSYPKLLAWWTEQNPKGRHIWPGLSITGVGGRFGPDDIIKRIQITRNQPGATGEIFFSMNDLTSDKAKIGTELRSSVYAAPALVPPSPWMDNQAPAAPTVQAVRDANSGVLSLNWAPPAEPDAFQMAIYAQSGGQWMFAVVPAASRGYKFAAGAPAPEAVVMSVVDRTGNESQKVAVNLGGGALPVTNPGAAAVPSAPVQGAAPAFNIPSPVSAPPLPSFVNR